jgi:hypothetical protein
MIASRQRIDVSSPVVGLSGGFLYSMFSWSALVAIATIPLMSPLSGFVARLTYSEYQTSSLRHVRKSTSVVRGPYTVETCVECDKALAEARDARIGAMRELLISVKMIKVSFQPNVKSLNPCEPLKRLWPACRSAQRMGR